MGFGSDGASVNMGKRGGVGAKLKESVPHLVKIHCVAHRLELAANTAIKNHSAMKKVQDVLQHIYKHYHYSPKALRELNEIGEALEQQVLKPGNLGGTRWLPRVERALETLGRNYAVIVAHFEHIISSRSGTAEVQGRAKFITKLLKDYSFMYFVYFTLDMLGVLSILSKKLQEDELTLSKMFDALTTTHLSLIELKHVDGPKLSMFLQAVENNSYKGVTLERIQDNEAYRNSKQDIIGLVTDTLGTRFGESEKDEVIKAATVILAIHDYPKDLDSLATYGNDELRILSEHFRILLERADCDIGEIQNEWKDLKAYIYRHRPSQSQLFTQVKDRFKNVLQIFEICLVFPLSSAACERGFSAMKRIKNDWRSILKPDMLRMLMYIVIEGPSESNFNPQSTVNRWWKTGRKKRPGFNPNDFMETEDAESEDET